MAYCAYCGSHVAEVSWRACASCGRPTNGAPAPVGAGGSKTNPTAIVIVVVVVVLGLIAFSGILAAIAIPNLLTAMQRSRQKRTMADMRTIAVAVETFAVEKGHYPPGKSTADVAAAIGKTLPSIDGWSQPYRYECWSDANETNCTEYAIASGGADKKFEHETLREYTSANPTNFDCDIVYAREGFVQYPGGTR